MTMPAVHILTLGCPKNEVDSDRMAARLLSAGAEVTPDLDSAEVAVVNTCAFIQAATEESIDTIIALAREWKSGRPERLLVVAGCLASRYSADLAAEMPEVDAFVPVADEETIAEVVAALRGATPASGAYALDEDEYTLRTTGVASAYVTIADGCHRACTYCTIPSIRGDYASRPADDIVAEASLLTAGGAREVVLIGQDISSYGRAMPQRAPMADLAGLVTRLADGVEVPALAWLRLMYVQPDGVTDQLLAAMAASPRVCRYLDMPLQHSSAPVLRAMGRRGDAERFLDTLSRVRTVMPDIKLRTTFIAGFPGETEADLEVLLAFVEAARFDYAGVFPYSPEDGTPAALLPGQLAEAERLARTQRVMDAAEAIGTAKVAGLEGQTLEVLVEGEDTDAPFGDGIGAMTVGRWRGQAPEVDGVVYLDRPARPGAIVSARITDTLGYDLMGETAR
jgi:ribosomal protein S12 methylthiotransferase